MTLEPSNLSHLADFIANTGLPVEDLDDLERLLESVNAATESDPEKRQQHLLRQKEALASQERQQKQAHDHAERQLEREHAHEERLRSFEHEERMRAYAVGLEDPAVLTARAKAARRVASFVPLVAFAAATVATWRGLGHAGYLLPLRFIAIIWGVCGVVGLAAVMAGALLLRSRRPSRLPAAEELAAKDVSPSNTGIVTRPNQTAGPEA